MARLVIGPFSLRFFLEFGPLVPPGAGDFSRPYESGARAYGEGGNVPHTNFVLVEEGVPRKRVVWDMGNPLESPFFGVPYLGRGAGNLGDVTHSWDGSLGIEVDPNGGGDRGVGYEIGAFDELFEGFFP